MNRDNRTHTNIVDGMNSWQRACKRMLDIVGAILSLIIFSPLFIICYLMIVTYDKRPIIYSQERVGLGGRSFRIYKFRTMYNDSEQEEPILADLDNDPRLTKIGGFLRQHHLDELPQLWNVLKGDMSFVGPRPERQFFITKIMECDKRYEELFRLRPGITSMATLYNGYTDTMEKMLKRLEMDLNYLEHRSLVLDMSILWKTFYSIVIGKRF